ncbi:MAG: hypothetical protein M0P91_14110 [Sulfuricurvum sp.]|uniref:hypothetical protein n=1 Tax=Sulfuricurvum sp. TaxID=2025608 RepID=UPI0025DBD36F|nr:hypothetical protein [Sulfuricurvum sp.]MCK9374311.1 hypothetical protein [Sulfuricurvum sp.]
MASVNQLDGVSVAVKKVLLFSLARGVGCVSADSFFSPVRIRSTSNSPELEHWIESAFPLREWERGKS